MRTHGVLILAALFGNTQGIRTSLRATVGDNAYTDVTVSGISAFGTNDGIQVDPGTGKSTMTADSRLAGANKGSDGTVSVSSGDNSYGMTSRTFSAPATPISEGLSTYVAPVITVLGCQPSDDGGRRNCKQGKSTYNLQIPAVIKAQ